MDEKKVKAIQEQPTPKLIIKVKTFHGLASFYRRFVIDCNTLATSLTKIIRKSVGFKQDIEQGTTFKILE